MYNIFIAGPTGLLEAENGFFFLTLLRSKLGALTGEH